MKPRSSCPVGKRYHVAALACVALTVCRYARAADQPTVLEPVVVTPSAYSLVERVSSPAEVSVRDAENLPLIDNDVMRTVHLFPGVVANDFSARFQLRGSEKDEVAVRLDGIELLDPFHLQDFGGALSSIDLSLVRDGRLYMGGFAPRYGDSTGGVFDLQTHSPNRQGITRLSFDIVNLQAQREGALGGDGSYLLSARRGYVDWLLALIDRISPLEEKFRPRFFDTFGKVELPLGSDDTLTAYALYARDTNEIDKLGRIDDLRSTYDSLTLGARWRRTLDAASEVDVTPYGSLLQRDRREGEQWDIRDVQRAGVRVDYSRRLARGHTPGAGVDLAWAHGDYDYLETTDPFPELEATSAPIRVEADVRSIVATAYAEDNWQIGRDIGLVWGGRVLAGSGASATISPRIAAAWRAATPLTLRVAWGRYIQPVDASNLPVEGGITESQAPERASHAIAGAEWSVGRHATVRAEAYAKEYRDLVGRVRDVGRKSSFVLLPLPTSGRAYGGEMLVQRATGSASFSGGYALSVARVRRREREVPRDFDQRHSVVANGSWHLSDSLALNAGWRFHTGTPLTPVAFVPSDDPAKPVPVLGDENSERTPSFHSLDVRLTKQFKWTTWQMTAYVQVMNAYFRNNVQEYSYDPEQGFAQVEESFLPFTPTFGLIASF